MRRLEFHRDAYKFLRDLDAKQFKQVTNKVFLLAINPQQPDSKKLENSDHLRADIGEFRIIYRFDDENVYVDAIGKRGDDDIYKKFERR